MKKISFFIFASTLFLIFFSSGIEKTFSQTTKLIAENLTYERKIFIIDSVALFDFIEKKENEMKIEAYLESRNAPLAKYASKFVEVAEKYDLPVFLLPTISIKESSGGKKLFKSYNAFGYGSKHFSSFEEAIEYVANQLTHGKYYKGKTLDKKLSTYNSVKNIPTRKYPRGQYTEETYMYMKKFENQKIDSIDYRLYVDSFKVENVIIEHLIPQKEKQIM